MMEVETTDANLQTTVSTSLNDDIQQNSVSDQINR